MSRSTYFRKRRTVSRLLAILSAALLASSVATAALTTPAEATTAPGWGPGGAVRGDSPVTVRWDNDGNPPSSVVSRDQTQKLPHTAGKTYADLAPSVTGDIRKLFQDLEVTVSHTTNLVNQVVQVSAAGAEGGDGTTSGTWLEVFQCWGTAEETAPDPEHCQTGASWAGVGGRAGMLAGADSDLVLGADWEHVAWTKQDDGSLVRNGSLLIPFGAIDGSSVPDRHNNVWFSNATTNELSGGNGVVFTQAGSGERSFEVQSTAEAQGLGCGKTDTTASTDRCWLVIVPMAGPSASQEVWAHIGGSGAVSPTVWANRLQVELGMRDLGGVCGSGTARTLLAGSELLADAMASWIPDLCADNINTGYTILGDAQVRRELEGGTRGYGIISTPTTANAQTVPLAFAGAGIGYSIDNRDRGVPITDLKLNPRLVAKLLTQSYATGMDSRSEEIYKKAPWWGEWEPWLTLTRDPEFIELNPDLGGITTGDDLIVTITDTDTGRAVWDWIVQDDEARSFLSGCPDDNGKVINPFFSSREYTACTAQKAALDATAERWITSTITPEGFVHTPAVYPPASTLYPQPSWYQRDAKMEYRQNPQTGKWEQYVTRGILSLADLHPRENYSSDVGRTVARAIYPSNADWCPYETDVVACSPPPGKWKRVAVPDRFGKRAVSGITDTVAAARFQLPTARLCATADATGTHCVGADEASVRAAADRFTTGADGALVVPDKPDYRQGAYPLTLPIQVAVRDEALSGEQVTALRAVLTGVLDRQKSGSAVGELPRGYVPLSGDQLAAARATVSQLHGNEPTPTPVPTPSSATIVPGPGPTAPVNRTPAAPAPAPVAAPPPTTSGAVASPEVVAKVGTTPPMESGFPQFALVGGLAAALAAGVASPIVGGPRRRVS